MTDGPFGLPRPFAESKPVLKVVVNKKTAKRRAENFGAGSSRTGDQKYSELYNAVLFRIEDEIGYQKTDSVSIGTGSDEGFEVVGGRMVHFGFDLSSLKVEDFKALSDTVKKVFGSEAETFFEAR